MKKKKAAKAKRRPQEGSPEELSKALDDVTKELEQTDLTRVVQEEIKPDELDDNNIIIEGVFLGLPVKLSCRRQPPSITAFLDYTGRHLESVTFKVYPKPTGYIISPKTHHEGKRFCETFEELYNFPWLDLISKSDLKAVEKAYQQKRKQLEAHMEVELSGLETLEGRLEEPESEKPKQEEAQPKNPKPQEKQTTDPDEEILLTKVKAPDGQPIKIKIRYLPKPLAIDCRPLKRPKEILSVLYRDFHRDSGRGFVLRQVDYKRTDFRKRFSGLYSIEWVNAEARLELDAIKDGLEQRAEKIAAHMKHEVSLD